MDVKRKIHAIFQDAKNDLCSFLTTDSRFFQELVDGDALSGDNKERLEDIKTKKAQRQELIDMLQERSNEAYFTFMCILQKRQHDLHASLKKLEEKHELDQKVADPIAMSEKSVKAANFIHESVNDVRAFGDLAKELDNKIQLMKPSLDFVSNMKAQRQELTDACEREPQLDLFGASLSNMLSCVEEVQDFIDGIKNLTNDQKIAEKSSIKAKHENLVSKLDELLKSIGVLTEVKEEVTTEGTDAIQSLVKHAKKSGVFSATAQPIPGNDNAPEETPPTLGASALPVLSLKSMELIKDLGEGGFGSVWLASQKQGGEVAVKIFDMSNNHEVLKEASKMQRAINSPYIVRLVGIIDEPKCKAIVMDFFQNGSLKSFMKYLNCDCWARRMRMLCDVSFGINYLHNLTPPIVHKDIKACNIFIDHGLMAKLGDLGLSSSNTTERNRTQAVITGTVSHIPPEAWAGKKATISCDIYEFGITLYEFSSGENPWPYDAKPEVIRGLVYTDDKRPDEKNIKDSTPKEVTELMRKCWQRVEDARPTSQELQERLTTLFEQSYKSNIDKADEAIREQMKLYGMTVEMKNSSSASGDSGIASTERSFSSSTERNVRASNIRESKKEQTSVESDVELVAEFDEEVKTTEIRWKQESFLGFGGKRKQTYQECHYKFRNEKITVFIQSDRYQDIPKKLVFDSELQYGVKKDTGMFFVLHDKRQKPFKKRFLPTLMKQAASEKNIDPYWLFGEYLHDVDDKAIKHLVSQ